MGSVPNHERLSPKDSSRGQRGAELLRQEIEVVARAVAVRCGLPYELEALREAGKRGVRDALARGGHDKLGWSFLEHVRRPIYERVLKCAKQFQNEAIQTPTGRRLREALEAFSANQWETLVAGFG